MNTVNEKYTAQRASLKNAIMRFGEVLEMEQDEKGVVRDSAIQRFEFCFDLSWKTIKTYLQTQHGIACASPKECIKEASGIGLIKETETFWLTMSDLRNLTSHTYNEKTADEIYRQLPATHQHFLTLLKQLEE